MKSVQSINPSKSVIQTSYDIVKAHGEVLNVETKENVDFKCTIQLPLNQNG